MASQTGGISLPGRPAQKIAVIGCGLIGQAWAVVFLRSGHRVSLYDAVPGKAEQAHAGVANRLEELKNNSLLDLADIAGFLENLEVEQDMESALDGAIYVQENGPEDLKIKAELTASIDRIAAADVPIGSSTSAIPASHYSADVPGRHRCLVVHPINPPHLVPLVEIVPSPWTAKGVATSAMDLMRSVNQSPILIEKEIDGFVVNRLQGALLKEAFRLLADGVATFEDIDSAIRDGLALRWSVMGPFETIHLNAPGGIAQYVERYGRMYREMFEADQAQPDWRAVVESGLEEKLCERHPLSTMANAHGARDRGLMKLLASRSTARKS